MNDKEIKERLKSVPKTERACSYTIWPYGPEEYKGQRFGSLPESFLKWIVANLAASKEDRNQLLAQRAKEEFALRDKIARKMYGVRPARTSVPFRRAVIKPITAEDAFAKPDAPINPAPGDFLVEEDYELPSMIWSEKPFRWDKPKKKSPKKAEPEVPPKPKKHGIEL